MGMIAHRLNLRLFLDGIEVPVIGAKTTHAEGAGARAEIQVVGTDQVYEIEPRSFVTLFFYENYDFAPALDGKTAKIGPKDLRHWKLLYAGELTGIAFAKRGTSRQATLICADHTNYWDFIKQHYINFRNAGIERFETAFLGVRQDRIKFFDVITQGVHSKLYVWLTKSKNSNGEASLYLGVQRVLREMFFAANDFYATAFNRLRIGDQIVGLAGDETAAKLFKLQFFEKFIKNRLGGAGGGTTARQLIGMLLGPVFHTYVTVPAPKFDRKGEALGFDPSNPDEGADDLNSECISRDKAWPGASLNYTIIKPDTWFLAPPLCNIVLPHMYNQLSFSRNFLLEPTRLFLRTSLTFTGTDKWLTERFYAPDFESFNDQMFGHDGGFFDRMASTVLPHETFVGLNPVMTWQPELSTFVAKGARREYLGRLTDYLFWKYRFSTRNVNVSGPFNPDLVPGYPGLVVDRVGILGQFTRHFLGNINTVVHSIDQTGGRTHFTMVGARTHEENIDFSDEGRTLEEITSRGTDGFLDDRYDPVSIGEEVYQPLFGIGSLIDLLDKNEQSQTREENRQVKTRRTLTAAEQAELQAAAVDNVRQTDAVNEDKFLPTTDRTKQLRALQAEYQQRINAVMDKAFTVTSEPVTITEIRPGLTVAAVAKLLELYQKVLTTRGNVERFAQSLTLRPKATFLEVMGNRIQFSSEASGESSFSPGELLALRATDPDLLSNDGFFHSAVDPLAPNTIDSSFVAVTKRTVNTPKETRLAAPIEDLGDGSAIVNWTEAEAVAKGGVLDPETGDIVIDTSTSETFPVKSQGNYKLKEQLDSRQTKVLAYVASLRPRGLRG